MLRKIILLLAITISYCVPKQSYAAIDLGNSIELPSISQSVIENIINTLVEADVSPDGIRLVANLSNINCLEKMMLSVFLTKKEACDSLFTDRSKTMIHRGFEVKLVEGGDMRLLFQPMMPDKRRIRSLVYWHYIIKRESASLYIFEKYYRDIYTKLRIITRINKSKLRPYIPVEPLLPICGHPLGCRRSAYLSEKDIVGKLSD